MKKQRWLMATLLIFPLACGFWLQGCTDTFEEDPMANQYSPFELTQSMLDGATRITFPSDLGIVGNPFLVQSPQASALIRDIVTNNDKRNGARKGDIYVIRAFENLNGVRGKLILADIMVKRQIGFNPDGLDFEYIRIWNDPSVNSQQHPNGLLPAANNARFRGNGLNIDNVNCITCHLAVPDDFIFSN